MTVYRLDRGVFCEWRSILARLTVSHRRGLPIGIATVALNPGGVTHADAGDFCTAASRVDRWLSEGTDSPAIELDALIMIFDALGQDAAELAIARAISDALATERGA
jgi:hypothetical protein